MCTKSFYSTDDLSYTSQSVSRGAGAILELEVSEGGFIARVGFIFDLYQAGRAWGHARRLVQWTVKQDSLQELLSMTWTTSHYRVSQRNILDWAVPGNTLFLLNKVVFIKCPSRNLTFSFSIARTDASKSNDFLFPKTSKLYYVQCVSLLSYISVEFAWRYILFLVI